MPLLDLTSDQLLADHLSIRRPTLADLTDVLNLYNSFDIPKYGQPNQSLESIQNMWTSPDFDLQTDAWLVVTQNGQPVGYIHVVKDEGTSFRTNGGVHPEYRKQGIGTHLLHVASARVQERTVQFPSNAYVTMSSFSLVTPINEAEAHLLKREGYQTVRHFWDMEIELETAPPVPVWPDGITIRHFVPEQDERILFEAFTEAFQDIWGYFHQAFEIWSHDNFALDTFDPGLYFLACEGEAIVGFAMCAEAGEMGQIHELGVRRTWRKHGLGRALLLHCFNEFAQRGKRIAHLSVDSESLTGATRLYERVGMHTTLHHDLYQKILRWV